MRKTTILASSIILFLAFSQFTFGQWRSLTLDNHHGHVVRVGDYIYGANWYNNRNGKWVCLDWKTGEVMWAEKWFTKGSIISADDMLYIYEEKSGNAGIRN